MQHLLSAPVSTESLDTPLSGPGLLALRDAVRAYGRGLPADSTLRQSVRLLCESARFHDQRIEQFLVALKETWWSLPEVEHVSRDAAAVRALLSRVISMCIEQFYAAEQNR